MIDEPKGARIMGVSTRIARFVSGVRDDMTNRSTELRLKSADLFGGNFPVKHSGELGASIVNGKLKVIKWLDALEYDDPGGLDWNIEHTNSPTTFQLFLQGLNPILYLVGAFVESGDEDYFRQAVAFYESWAQFEGSESSRENAYVWDQHAAALRAENILAMLLVGAEHGLFSESEMQALRAMLVCHAGYHMNPDTYLAGENHGLFQDRALLYLGYAFGRRDWVRAAVGRIKEQWVALFDEEMACTENSFTYQRLDKNLFIDVCDILKRKAHPMGAELFRKINAAEDFMGFALMPNSICPPYGDTYRSDYYLCDSVDDAGVLAFSASRGERGVVPSTTRRVYYSSGYYFGRQFWENSEPGARFEDSVWTMFRSGYSSITHRQSDDNSFMLYAFGKEVFTDAGVYNYMYRDPLRIYVRSSLAHNAVFVDGKSYDFLRKGNTGLVGFRHCEMGVGGVVDYVVGFNGLYYGVVWLRHFVFFADGVFLLDELFSKKEHVYSQVFHCGPEIEHVDADGLDAKVVIDESRCRYASLEQLHSTEEVTSVVCEGSEASRSLDPPFGITGGSDLNEVEYVTVLEYQQSGKNVDYATAILACDAEDRKGEVAYDPESRMLTLDSDDGSISLKLKEFDLADLIPATEFDFSDVSVEAEGSTFRFRYSDAQLKDRELAWYVMGNHGKRTLCKVSYAPEGTFEFDFSNVEDPDCAIKVFVRNPKTGMGGSQIICGIRHDPDSDEWRYEYWPDWDEGWHEWFGGTEAPSRSTL